MAGSQIGQDRGLVKLAFYTTSLTNRQKNKHRSGHLPLVNPDYSRGVGVAFSPDYSRRRALILRLANGSKGKAEFQQELRII